MPKGFLKIYFLCFGLLDAVALSVAFYYSLSVIGTFFSYFTVLSNIFITIVFLFLGLYKKKKIPKLIIALYPPAVLYMTITGIVFWTILRNNHHLETIMWINLVLHAAMPIAVFIGWVLFSPRKYIPFKTAFAWLIFPLFFVFYTLVRGPIVNWYPYPFLNPKIIGGYEGVFLYVLGILAGSFVVSLFIISISNAKNKK